MGGAGDVDHTFLLGGGMIVVMRLEIEWDGAVLLVAMNRPEERNAISDRDACLQFVAVCRDVNAIIAFPW